MMPGPIQTWIRNAVCATLLVFAAVPTNAGDTYTYRGPANNGIFPARGLLKKWPESGPPLLWKANIGAGWAHPAVVGDTVYAAGGLTALLYGYSLDGELKFKYPYGSAIWKRFSGTRSVPLITDEVAVVTAPNGNIFAIDLRTGETRWTCNAWKSFGLGKGVMGWGWPETPARCGNTMIFNTCSRYDETPPLVAVDMNTGRTVWELPAGNSKKNYSAGDVSGACFRHNGIDLVVHATWRWVVCANAKTGEKYWEIPTEGEKNLTPVYNDGLLFFGLAGSERMIRLSEDGKSFTHLWDWPGTGFPHAVLVNGRVYKFGKNTDRAIPSAATSSAKSTNDTEDVELAYAQGKKVPGVASLLCIDAVTGRLIHSIPNPGDGHIIFADGMVYALANGGPGRLNVSLVKPTAPGMELVSTFTINSAGEEKFEHDERWIAPAIAEGRLFVKYGPLRVYDLRAEPSSVGWRHDGTGSFPNARPPVKWAQAANTRWTTSLPGPARSAVVASVRDVVVVCEPNTLTCLNPADGTVRWRNPIGTGTGSFPAPVLRQDGVVAAAPDGTIASFDLAGRNRWKTRIEPGRSAASPVLAGDVVVIQGKELVALAMTDGKPVWTVPVPDGTWGTPVKAYEEGAVLVTAWGTVIGATDGRSLARDLPRTGNLSPVIDGDRIVTASDSASVVAVSQFVARPGQPTRVETAWTRDLTGPRPVCSPVTDNGLLYLLTVTGDLVALDAASGQPVYAQKLDTGDEKPIAGVSELVLVRGNLYVTGLGTSGLTIVTAPGRKFSEIWRYAAPNGMPAGFAGDAQFLAAGQKLFCMAGPAPSLPAEPSAVRIDPVPDAELKPGVPVGPLADNKIPDAWVVTGPFPKRDLETDHLAPIGGRIRAMPAVDTTFTLGASNCVFRPIREEHRWQDVRFTAGMKAVDITGAMNRQAEATGYFFTVLRNDKARMARFTLLTPDGISWNGPSTLRTRAWLAGQPLTGNQVLDLAPGLYPLMIQVSLGTTESWGKIWMGPRFQDVTDDMNRRKSEYTRAAAEWPAYTQSLQQLFVLK